ncbi:MAG: CocE/NonD family hydrolase [Blastocatellia bacterium]
MKLSRVFVSCLVVAFALVAAADRVPSRAQSSNEVRAAYIKHEYQIPMRDGVKLFTSVYMPKDTSQKYPILLNRTPYSVAPYGADAYKTMIGPSPLFQQEGYIFVYQDVRGRSMSEGSFMDMRPHKARKSGPTDADESSDTYDTIDWLVKNIPNNNGRVGIWGISYPGFYTAMGLVDAHPALKAASPQAPISDLFIGDDMHHNGAFWLSAAFGFYSFFGPPRPRPTTEGPKFFDYATPDGYKFFLELGPLANADKKYFKGNIAFWNEMMAHPNYDDFWQARNTGPQMVNIKPAVLTVGGWFDAEDLFGTLNTYKAIEQQNPGARNTLVMGPWFHGGWARSDGDALGNVQFGSKTSLFYRENIELPFFNYYLKDKGEMRLPEAYVFNTGANEWRTFAEWPPANTETRSVYLDAGGKATMTAPASQARSVEYVSDPDKPVPVINNTDIDVPREYMVDDQRFAARRPDVVVYQTEAMIDSFTVAGPIKVSLDVSTTGTDADFIVKVIDVYPDDAPDPNVNPAQVRMGGYQMLVRGEPFRARFRNSFSKPEAMIPGRRTHIEFEMPDVFHTFLKGHRLMIQVQSTWFPMVDRNPQKFVNIYTATEADFQKATERVYSTSHVTFNVIKTP